MNIDPTKRNGIQMTHSGAALGPGEVNGMISDDRQFQSVLEGMVRKYKLAADGLTEIQLAECIKQALVCGDFVKYVAKSYTPEVENVLYFNQRADSKPALQSVAKQSVVYIPYREIEQLKARISELENLLQTPS
jgi:hypothetical protein